MAVYVRGSRLTMPMLVGMLTAIFGGIIWGIQLNLGHVHVVETVASHGQRIDAIERQQQTIVQTQERTTTLLDEIEKRLTEADRRQDREMNRLRDRLDSRASRS